MVWLVLVVKYSMQDTRLSDRFSKIDLFYNFRPIDILLKLYNADTEPSNRQKI